MLPDQDKLLSQLYQDHFGKLTMYALAVLKNESRAQDAVQDTFHEAITHIDILIQHPNPSGWLMVTLKNKIKEYQRETQKYMLRFLSLSSDLLIEPGQHDPQIEQQLNADGPPIIERIKQALTPEEYLLLKRLTIDQASHLRPGQSPRSGTRIGNFCVRQPKEIGAYSEEIEKSFPGPIKFSKIMSGS